MGFLFFTLIGNKPYFGFATVAIAPLIQLRKITLHFLIKRWYNKIMKSNLDMKNTSLCYIEKDGAYLMLHRVKKENDINRDKYVGIGGKFENGESPFDCALREIKEETGVSPLGLKYCGIVTFVSDKYGTEYMHLFTANGYDGELKTDCNEGNLVWIKKESVYSLPVWEGDKIFFRLLEKEEKFFSLKLVYQGDKLISHELNV